MRVYDYLLALHITAGVGALAMALLALMTTKGGKGHIRSGRVYALAMAIVVATALPMSLIRSDLFLLLIAIFAGYLVFAGWRFGRNRSGKPARMDWAACGLMLATGLGMSLYALWLVFTGSGLGIALGVFGIIAMLLGWTDARAHRAANTKGKKRIARHLTNMLAGTIATLTATLVTNVETSPVWLGWLLPTLIITPIITWWNFRILKPGATPR